MNDTIKIIKNILLNNNVNYDILSIYHNKDHDYYYVVVNSEGEFKDKYKIYIDGSINPVDIDPNYMFDNSFEKIYSK